MSRTGPGTPTLSERLAAKTAADREQIEAAMLNEQQHFAESLRNASKAALAGMESDMAAHQAKMTSSLRELLRWPLWSAAISLSVILASIALLWGVTWWMRGDLAEIRSATSAATMERQNEEENLRLLRDQTHGVWIHTPQTGPALVLVPPNTDLKRITNCQADGKPMKCIELPARN